MFKENLSRFDLQQHLVTHFTWHLAGDSYLERLYALRTYHASELANLS